MREGASPLTLGKREFATNNKPTAGFFEGWGSSNFSTPNPKVQSTSRTSTYQSSYSIDDSGIGKFKIVKGEGQNDKPMRYEVTQGTLNSTGEVLSSTGYHTNDARLAYSPTTSVPGSKKPHLLGNRSGSSLGQAAAKALDEAEHNLQTNGTPSGAAFSPTRSQRSDSTYPGNLHFDILAESASVIKENKHLGARPDPKAFEAELNHPRHWRDTFE